MELVFKIEILTLKNLFCKFNFIW